MAALYANILLVFILYVKELQVVLKKRCIS